MIRQLSSFVFASSLLAQGGPIFVVDAASGPGTNYTDVQAAVLAVPDGSVLLVRPGTYAPLTIDGKGVTVLAESSFTIGGSLWIRNTLSQQRVLVRGFVLGGFGSNVEVTNAAGAVTVDAVGQQLVNHGWGQSGIVVSGSPQVDIRNCTVMGAAFAPGCAVANSSVVFENCTLRGSNGFFMNKAGGATGMPALSATASTVQFVHSSAYGGNGAVFVWMGNPAYQAGSAAIVMNSGSLRATGLATHQILGGTHPAQPQYPSISGSGAARVDPLVVLAGLPVGVTLTRPTMPSLLADSAAPGGVLTVQRHGAPGLLCATALSLRAAPTTLPWLPDPIWLDLSGLIVEGAGITPASGPFVVTKNVPNNPLLRGFEFVWQSTDLDATGVLAVSNASPGFVR